VQGSVRFSVIYGVSELSLEPVYLDQRVLSPCECAVWGLAIVASTTHACPRNPTVQLSSTLTLIRAKPSLWYVRALQHLANITYGTTAVLPTPHYSLLRPSALWLPKLAAALARCLFISAKQRNRSPNFISPTQTRKSFILRATLSRPHPGHVISVRREADQPLRAQDHDHDYA
jgi:hypothetical protein